MIDSKSPEFLAFAAQCVRNLDDHWAALQKEQVMTTPLLPGAGKMRAGVEWIRRKIKAMMKQ